MGYKSMDLGLYSEDIVIKDYLERGYIGGKLVKHTREILGMEPSGKPIYKWNFLFNYEYVINPIFDKYKGDEKKLTNLKTHISTFKRNKYVRDQPDLMFLSPNNKEIIFVEVKTNKSKITEKQKRQQDYLKYLGFRVIIRKIYDIEIPKEQTTLNKKISS